MELEKIITTLPLEFRGSDPVRTIQACVGPY